MLAFLSSSLTFAGNFLAYLLPFLFVLALVVFIHEMGHFLIGRWCGVKVETFSLGFGPRLARFYDRSGTEWALSAIPLGGYVKFKGDLNAASQPDPAGMAAMPLEEQRDSFPHKSIGQRAAIVAAGPLANFVLAFVIFTAMFTIYGRTQTQPLIGAVQSGSAAEVSGLRSGDRILAVDGQKVENFAEIVRIVSISEGRPLRFEVERAGQSLEIEGTPRVISEKSVFGTNRRAIMGISSSPDPEAQFTKHFSLFAASRESVHEIAFIIERTGAYLTGLIRGQEKADQLSGPLRIAYMSGKVAESGLRPLLFLAAILSISIGLINLLPVPMLDGGHLVFYAIEALFGRPVSPRAQELSFRVGFALVIGLMLFSTWNDVVHLAGFAL